MSTFVFVGPTLTWNEGAAIVAPRNLNWCPPARRGDIYQAAHSGARVIVLIDGCFGNEPAVTHKEILWAMSKGVTLIGVASMGALRAAELGAFGMHGMGHIYRAFVLGELYRDDEVAVEHGPYLTQYSPTSLPLVNIRYTVARAEQRSRISRSIAADIIRTASELYFGHRTWCNIIEVVVQKRQLPRSEAVSLLELLNQLYVDRKRMDAILALRWLVRAKTRIPKMAKFEFENTFFFAQFTRTLRSPFRFS